MLPLRLFSEFTVKEHGVLGAGVPTSYSAANECYFRHFLDIFESWMRLKEENSRQRGWRLLEIIGNY